MVNNIYRKWTVRLTTQARESADIPPGDGRIPTLVNLLRQAYGAEASPSDSAVEVRLPVEDVAVHTADEAALCAQRYVLQALENVGLGDWEVSAGEVIPTLIGAQEVCDLLGISRQRLHELRRLPGRFPIPSAELAAGPVWTRTTIEEYATKRNRRPGRPRLGRVLGAVPVPGGGYRGECRGCYRFTTSTVHETMREAVQDPELRAHRC